jgi:hypothetical protein
MPQPLELPQLPHGDGVPQVQVDAGGVDAVLYPQRPPGLRAVPQLLRQLLFRHDFLDAAANDGKLFINGGKRHRCGLDRFFDSRVPAVRAAYHR